MQSFGKLCNDWNTFEFLPGRLQPADGPGRVVAAGVAAQYGDARAVLGTSERHRIPSRELRRLANTEVSTEQSKTPRVLRKDPYLEFVDFGLLPSYPCLLSTFVSSAGPLAAHICLSTLQQRWTREMPKGLTINDSPCTMALTISYF